MTMEESPLNDNLSVTPEGCVKGGDGDRYEHGSQAECVGHV